MSRSYESDDHYDLVNEDHRVAWQCGYDDRVNGRRKRPGRREWLHASYNAGWIQAGKDQQGQLF